MPGPADRPGGGPEQGVEAAPGGGPGHLAALGLPPLRRGLCDKPSPPATGSARAASAGCHGAASAGGAVSERRHANARMETTPRRPPERPLRRVGRDRPARPRPGTSAGVYGEHVGRRQAPAQGVQPGEAGAAGGEVRLTGAAGSCTMSTSRERQQLGRAFMLSRPNLQPTRRYLCPVAEGSSCLSFPRLTGGFCHRAFLCGPRRRFPRG